MDQATENGAERICLTCRYLQRKLELSNLACLCACPVQFLREDRFSALRTTSGNRFPLLLFTESCSCQGINIRPSMVIQRLWLHSARLLQAITKRPWHIYDSSWGVSATFIAAVSLLSGPVYWWRSCYAQPCHCPVDGLPPFRGRWCTVSRHGGNPAPQPWLVTPKMYVRLPYTCNSGQGHKVPKQNLGDKHTR